MIYEIERSERKREEVKWARTCQVQIGLTLTWGDFELVLHLFLVFVIQFLCISSFLHKYSSVYLVNICVYWSSQGPIQLWEPNVYMRVYLRIYVCDWFNLPLLTPIPPFPLPSTHFSFFLLFPSWLGEWSFLVIVAITGLIVKSMWNKNTKNMNMNKSN